MNTATISKRLGLLLATASLAIAAFAPGGASASFSCFENAIADPEPGSQSGFGVADGCFDGSTVDELGNGFAQAGGHPDQLGVSIEFNRRRIEQTVFGAPFPIPYPVEQAKTVATDAPPGLVGNPTILAQCTAEELSAPSGNGEPLCPGDSQVGLVTLKTGSPFDLVTEELLADGVYSSHSSLYNMVPPTGSAARFGFITSRVVVVLDATLRSDGDYGLTVVSKNASEALAILGVDVTFWGTPADPSHDADRRCPNDPVPGCSSTGAEQPFLTMPTACTAPGEGLRTTLRTDSWVDPGDFKTQSFVSHDPPFYPDPGAPGAERGPEGCDLIDVKGSLEAKPTSRDAETPSGLNVHVGVPNPGLKNPDGIASSHIKGVKVSLPQGLTINPSQAEGLGACLPAQYASTELSFHPSDKGCPEDSKVGSVEVKTPLLEETIPGDVYIAQPFDNPFGSLLALYVVLQEPQRGIQVKLAGKVETDEATGQITTTFENLPQLPFSSFDFKFREGARAPLVTPPACGSYTTETEIAGWSDPGNPIVSESSFTIDRGIGGGPCPSGGLPPFKPGLVAGSLNNNAGSYSPFNLRLFRTDGEQEITHFSIKLPPGLSGKLAGIPFCPDPAIAAAKSRSGASELASPSCPQASEVGRTLAGAGVGSVLTYAPGKIYLAGPYNGSALSIAAITAAKVGPFDLGTVVVRQALKVNPETAEVFIDATGSDPIPHIIKGITVHLRDIRAYVDRPEFTLNPTGCDPTSTASTVLGSGLDFTSAADDQPVTVTTRYQAANCASLGFKPKLKLSLSGATKRGGHPKLKAVLNARKGDANIGKAQVTLPHSAFLAQSHIRTICTRVQFKEGTVPGEKCPPGSIYGYAKAITPLLDEPLEGPVFLRSSSHPLPDLVAALHSGKIDVNLSGRIDSVKGGLIRNTFEAVPDAPVTKFTLTMQGGKKGLIENSTNLCRSTNRAIAAFDGHNGKAHDFNPVVKPRCGKQGKAKAKKR